MIIEAIISTADDGGRPNFAPMGVLFGPEGFLTMRPYSSSRTYVNLRDTGEGVVNIVDDVLLFVETALFSTCPPHIPAEVVKSPVIRDANTCYEFKVVSFNKSKDPGEVRGKIVAKEDRRSFRGFCRAGFAILELAIIATRINFLGTEVLQDALGRWGELVVKTGGEREKRALDLLENYICNLKIEREGRP